mgnify:FL=1
MNVVTFNKPPSDKPPIEFIGQCMSIPARGLTEETCRHWSYAFGSVSGKPAHLAHYLDANRNPVAIKVRFENKSFMWLGDPSKVSLYGRWLWSPSKKIVITEGEIDALTVSQLQQNRWPTVSVANGAQSAAKALKQEFEWLNQFESIVLMFDMDGPGQTAARECAELFEPGKVKIAKLPRKDANECLLKGEGEAVIRAMWDAEVYRPDGIIDGRDLWEKIVNYKTVPSPWLPYRFPRGRLGAA